MPRGDKPRKEALKELIRRLHAGATLEEAREEFKAVLKDTTPDEIAQIEDELIREGMPREEIQRLCDVHLSVFQEALEKKMDLVPPGHPVHILMEEHKKLTEFGNELRHLASQLKGGAGVSAASRFIEVVNLVRTSEPHYVREENVIFPYLEKHGITGPPAIMWMEHNQIRETKRSLYQLVDGREARRLGESASQLLEVATALAEMLSSHFYKENNILFPTSLRVMGPEEWREARPVDITFVDSENKVRYFSDTPERIFPRTKAVIGRSVQLCHPQKSIHIVNQILSDFRSGKRDVAEFWINLHGKLIHIRYFAVRSRAGEYLGCLEVTQDITDIQKIQGEKRLLD